MSIYITGDTHGEIDIHKLSTKVFPAQKEMSSEDYLIVTGDFGFPCCASDIQENSKAHKTYRYWLKWLKSKPFTILFVDGNHEHHDFWDAQPVREWHGGMVHIHPEADNIVHLIRGEIYTIDGETVFAFGGASSHDIEPQYDEFGRCVWKGRTEGENWFQRENASEAEKNRAREYLEQHGNQVDIIITHTPPKCVCDEILKAVGETPREDPTAEFLNEIQETVDYGLWVCGHIHKDTIDASRGIAVVYDTIAEVNALKEGVYTAHEHWASAQKGAYNG